MVQSMDQSMLQKDRRQNADIQQSILALKKALLL